MRELFVGIYVKLQLWINSVRNLFRLLLFTQILFREKVFGSKDPKQVLKVIKEFIELEHYDYPCSTVLSRDVEQSTILLSVLIDRYLYDSSNVTLEQLLEVLKNEFILRRRDGR